MPDATPQPAAEPPAASPGVGVRVLMLGWCLWLLGSWAVTLTLDSPIPAVRWMVFSAFTGLVLIWPMIRLSQDTRAGSGGGAAVILADWVCLILIFQAVVWPLRLVAGWSWEQALLIDAAMASWSLLAGAIAVVGRRFASAWARTAAMLLCLLLVLGTAAVRILAGLGAATTDLGHGWTAGLRPIATLWHLTGPTVEVLPSSAAVPVITAAIAAVAAWIGAAILGVGRS